MTFVGCHARSSCAGRWGPEGLGADFSGQPHQGGGPRQEAGVVVHGLQPHAQSHLFSPGGHNFLTVALRAQHWSHPCDAVPLMVPVLEQHTREGAEALTLAARQNGLEAPWS